MIDYNAKKKNAKSKNNLFTVDRKRDQIRFSHRNGVLTDSFAKMQWQDNSDTKKITKTWNGAKEYCSNLTLATKSDWRLPDKEELSYIYNYKDNF